MSYTNEQLIEKFNQFRQEPIETEWLEFKEAKEKFASDDLGRYFSALSNEANLKGKKSGWLILGIENVLPRRIVGTSYRNSAEKLDSLKHEIAQNTNGISFQEIYELQIEHKRVLMFQIPACPAGIITLWKGHAYGKDGESLTALHEHEREQIRRQITEKDWSAEICAGATIKDLDDRAVSFAREKFISKNKQNNRLNVKDIQKWEDMLFLEKIQLARKEQLTKAAILLLGKPESAMILTPHPAQITWKLEAEEEAYEHFGPPFLLSVEGVFEKIRNVKFRIQPFNQLVPVELTKYDSSIILEALNNCIAHQDYEQHARIIVTEKSDRIILRNIGSFYDGILEDYVLRDRKPERYRNPVLVQAMVQLDMIDTMGMGIRRMFNAQRERFFPLPEYDFEEGNHVVMTIFGRLIDENYSRILMEKSDLTLAEVILLDRIQKRKNISVKQARLLKKKHLIEGRAPSFYLSASISTKIGGKADYIKNRGFDKVYYENLILNYLKEFKKANRKELDDLLMSKLPEILSDKQKKIKITNLIYGLSKKKGIIENKAKSTKFPVWVLKLESK
ncbi:MAG: putative DNA binding domain-containing protein [Candidatus Omnitrophica bacterium]|nr:putative DNA binding domain-containing protein [Candidatus Omnitrophota bacterium]